MAFCMALGSAEEQINFKKKKKEINKETQKRPKTKEINPIRIFFYKQTENLVF